jgi:hypothetical protein
MLGSYWVAGQLAVSPEGPSSMELDSQLFVTIVIIPWLCSEGYKYLCSYGNMALLCLYNPTNWPYPERILILSNNLLWLLLTLLLFPLDAHQLWVFWVFFREFSRILSKSSVLIKILLYIYIHRVTLQWMHFWNVHGLKEYFASISLCFCNICPVSYSLSLYLFLLQNNVLSSWENTQIIRIWIGLLLLLLAYTIAWLVTALYKPKSHGFDSRVHWASSVNLILPATLNLSTTQLPGIFLSKARPARKAGKFTDTWEPFA